MKFVSIILAIVVLLISILSTESIKRRRAFNKKPKAKNYGGGVKRDIKSKKPDYAKAEKKYKKKSDKSGI